MTPKSMDLMIRKEILKARIGNLKRLCKDSNRLRELQEELKKLEEAKK